MPGFIDPHLHPTLAAVLLPCHFITAMEWKLPGRVAAPVKGHNAYLDRLKTIDSEIEDPAEPLVTWGYHKIWHGAVDRQALNGISPARPIFVWQRSFHEIIANDAAIDWMGLNLDDLARHEQIDPETGRFYETGLVRRAQRDEGIPLRSGAFSRRAGNKSPARSMPAATPRSATWPCRSPTWKWNGRRW